MIILIVKVIFAIILGLLGFLIFAAGIYQLVIPETAYKQKKELLEIKKEREKLFLEFCKYLGLWLKSFQLSLYTFLTFLMSFFVFLMAYIIPNIEFIVGFIIFLFIISVALSAYLYTYNAKITCQNHTREKC